MNKTAIRNFAIRARKDLLQSVAKMAKIYQVEEDKPDQEVHTTQTGQVLSDLEKKQRQKLIEKIKEDGFDQTIEEVAYTWFNRFIAIRFMEVNNFLPSYIRVFSASDGSFNPQILDEFQSLDFDNLDREKLRELYEASNKEELFNYLLISQCNDLSKILPGMFEQISDYTELLLPDGLLKEDSVIGRLVADIPEEDWQDQVQIIGWLYQYYNEEKKDQVINIFKGNIKKEDIPAATQIFTTDWVVKYLVDNSLGRYWIERNPNSSLRDKLEFLLTGKDVEIYQVDETIDPKDLKILDNCVGSGHFLVYEFEILMEIYKEYGYSQREASISILENNLYGLDIDERARQLAYFSLMMKARSYNRRIFDKNIKPHIHAIKESNEIDSSILDIFGKNLDTNDREEAKKQIKYLLDKFKDGKNYGSIIQIDPCDFDLLEEFISDLDLGQISVEDMHGEIYQEQILEIIQVAKILADTYHVVATNPPYLNKFNPSLKKYLTENYKDYKQDLFSVFIYKNIEMCKPGGYSGLMTPMVWMFIKSYEQLREYIINNKSISSLIQLEYSAFQEATVPICTFVLQNTKASKEGIYLRLSDFTGGMEVQKEKVLEAIVNPLCGYLYKTNQENFKKIPGMPIAYWASSQVIEVFDNASKMEDVLEAKQGLITGDTKRFLRLWHEVDIHKCKFDSKNAEELLNSKKKWIPYNKGGQRRQWYGNYDYLVNWENNGYEIMNFYGPNGKLRSRPQNRDYYFREAITWGLITSGGFSIRYRTSGGIHDVAGMSAFSEDKDKLFYTLGLMSTKISDYIFSMINPTINLNGGDFIRFPMLFPNSYHNTNDIVYRNISISKSDWDMDETSWDFTKSPLLANKVDGLLSSAYESYKDQVNTRFEKLKANEEELNRIFIEIYGLEEELDPQVSDRDITVAKIFDTKADIDEEIKGNRYILTKEDVIKKFLSYFIGCAMGRYSLDQEGLVFAGGVFDPSLYVSFKADEDGIIPLTREEYFQEDDIITRLEDFLRVTFGPDSLEENLGFIAEALGKKKNQTSREKIRDYFVDDFYKDHVKTYKKKPIYWMTNSGKLGGSRNLIYIHRYKKDTIARLRIRYLHEIQARYRQEVDRLENLLKTATGSDKISYQKEANSYRKILQETEKHEEKVQHLADSYIEIDLDDGVTENYKKFKDILAKI